MAATATASNEALAHDMQGVLTQIKRRAGLDLEVSVLIEAGLTEATAYRRMKKPGDLTLKEIRQIAARFQIPVHVIAAGELAVLRWVAENSPDPDDPSTQAEPQSRCTQPQLGSLRSLPTFAEVADLGEAA